MRVTHSSVLVLSLSDSKQIAHFGTWHISQLSKWGFFYSCMKFFTLKQLERVFKWCLKDEWHPRVSQISQMGLLKDHTKNILFTHPLFFPCPSIYLLCFHSSTKKTHTCTHNLFPAKKTKVASGVKQLFPLFSPDCLFQTTQKPRLHRDSAIITQRIHLFAVFIHLHTDGIKPLLCKGLQCCVTTFTAVVLNVWHATHALGMETPLPL